MTGILTPQRLYEELAEREREIFALHKKGRGESELADILEEYEKYQVQWLKLSEEEKGMVSL